MNKEVIANKELVAYCGLYCGACRAYLKGKCPGCKENEKATWCKVRKCGMENNYTTCADCTQMNPVECKKLNNFVSKMFSLVFRSDRNACIQRIREIGPEAFAEEMAQLKLQAIKRK